LFIKEKTNSSYLPKTEITHSNMIPFLKHSVKTEIINIHGAHDKQIKAKVALKKLGDINASYYDYLAQKGGVQHVEKFVTVRNIHFVYRQKTEAERKKAESEAQKLIKAAAEKAAANAKTAAEKAAKVKEAAANAKAAQQVAKSTTEKAVTYAMAAFMDGLNPEDDFYLFDVARKMMDPSKMEPFLKAL
jgi:hypothetical protein